MAIEETPLGVALNFLKAFGFYDVVLPFILVFAIVFAILEKTLILGKEKVDGQDKPRTSINAMVSFAVGLFVVAATNVVAVIKESLPMVVLVLIFIISFMLLVGSFIGSGEFSFEDSTFWKYFLTIIMFIAVILIFMSTIKTKSGVSWLAYVWDYMIQNWATGPIVSGIIFLVVIIASIIFIVWPFKGREPKTGSGG